MLRRVLCRIGWHRWQILYEPPHFNGGRGYRKAIFCIFCSREHRCKPGGVRDAVTPQEPGAGSSAPR